MLHRRSLPIAQPCPLATAVQPVGDGVGWCESCRLHVYDLSAMREDDARALVRARAGDRLCASYRVDAAGTIQFRDSPRGWASSAVIALLVACTGHGPAAAPTPEPAPLQFAPPVVQYAPRPPQWVELPVPGGAILGNLQDDGGEAGIAWDDVALAEPPAVAPAASRRARRAPKKTPEVDGRAMAESLFAAQPPALGGPGSSTLCLGGIIGQRCAADETPTGF